MRIGRVASLARFPVKSMGGEALDEALVGEAGFEGDRAWAVYTADGGIGSGKTSRRFRHLDGLLTFGSRLEAGGTLVRFPDGTRSWAGKEETDERLSEYFGQPLTLRTQTTVQHFDECPVHLVTAASLRRLAQLVGRPVDLRRVRANLLVEVPGSEYVDDQWVGRRLRVGDDLVLRIGPGMPRCGMVSAAQPGMPRDAAFLRALAQDHDLELGLQATVDHPGRIAIGAPVMLI